MLTKRNWLLIALLAALLGGGFIWVGCTPQVFIPTEPEKVTPTVEREIPIPTKPEEVTPTAKQEESSKEPTPTELESETMTGKLISPSSFTSLIESDGPLDELTGLTTLYSTLSHPANYVGQCFTKNLLVKENQYIEFPRSSSFPEGMEITPQKPKITFQEQLEVADGEIRSEVKFYTENRLREKLKPRQTYKFVICLYPSIPTKQGTHYISPLSDEKLEEAGMTHGKIKYVDIINYICWFYDPNIDDWSKTPGSKGPMSFDKNTIILVSEEDEYMVLMKLEG